MRICAPKAPFVRIFLDFLRTFRFTGDIWAVPEGTPVFPKEPILTVRAPAIEAQFIETYVLLTLNHQSLIATKANRIVRAAQGRAVSEFGSRRAQGADGAVSGARAAYLAGCSGTACAMADERYGVPAGGTMAHSWVQMFEDEFTALTSTAPCILPLLRFWWIPTMCSAPVCQTPSAPFRNTVLLMGAIRIDSGDLTYLSRRARSMLDAAGLKECKIVASNALDEYIIRDLINQGACIDAFGVGERLITSKSEPVFGGVYKLAAIEDAEGNVIPKIKVSENPSKVTTPHFKKVWRILNRKAIRR